jgi:hypothetical protein
MNTSTIEDIGKADGLVHSDDKHEVEMLEHEHKPSDAAATAGIDMRGQELTGYEDLTLFQTLMKFKKTSLICFAVTFSACAEGYEVRKDLQRSFSMLKLDHTTARVYRSEWRTTSTPTPVSIMPSEARLTPSTANESYLQVSWRSGLLSVLPAKSWVRSDSLCEAWNISRL